jgi:hypothetical protein
MHLPTKSHQLIFCATPTANSRHSLSGGASISTAQAPDHTRSDSADRVDNILKQFENATDHLLQFLNKESPRSGEALRTFEYAKGEVIRYMKERANEEGLGGQLQSAGNNLTTQEGGMFVE